MILVADARGVTDGPAHVFLSRIESPIPIVLVSRVQDFKFNPELEKLDKYVLVDFVELGWQWDQQTGHIWGKNTDQFPDVFPGDEWKRFDEFVIKYPPLLTFQRELLAKDAHETLIPIEYPNWQSEYPTQTKDEFQRRPIELFHYWGFSHPCRKRFQGEAHLHSLKEDITIIDNFFYLQNFLQENHKRYWATMHIPHFARLPINQILEVNGLSKLSLSLPGAGARCFRHSESCVNSCMVLQYDNLAWSYSWVHNENCIRAEPGKEIEAIEAALEKDNLYNIYVNCMKSARNYQVDNYIKSYIKPKIEQICQSL